MDGGGVAKIDLKQPKFNLFPLSEGDYPVLKDYFTKCFYEDEKKRIWFGSHNNGFSIYDPITTQLINYKNDPLKSNSLPGNSVAGIYKDKKANIWILTNAGISIFDEANASFKVIPIVNLPRIYPLVNLFAYKMLELKNGDLMLATAIGLVKISRINSGHFSGYYYGKKSFLESTSTDVIELDDQSLMVTMPSIGLSHLQPKNNEITFIKSYFNGLDLRSIRRDETRKNIVWIGSGKGLIEFNTETEKYKTWDEKDGLTNSYVYGSLEDEKHNLWISTNGGLSYLNRANNHVDNYSHFDGLQSNEFNTQAFYKSNSNTFYFGGIKGFNWFNSKSFDSSKSKPQVSITEIEVDNIARRDSTLFYHNILQLPYYKNDLNFKFAVLDYTRPEANRIQYILEGWDNNWVTTNLRSARYSNLPPGHYTMKIKAINGLGIWSDEESIKLVILKPFWKQGWFNLLLIALFIFAIVYITYFFFQEKVKRQLRILEKQAAIDLERNRISKDMHDEIGNGLTHIALLSELIQQHTLETGIKKDITGISTSARKLVQTMSEIIWALSPQNDTLDNLLAYIREQTHQYFDGLHLDYSIDFPEVNTEIKLTNEERRNLFLVAKEALTNAMKHANPKHIRLSLVIKPNNYCFNVEDDGKGMPESKMKIGSNGIRNMKKRMQDIKGTIDWINTNKGTRVEFCLPIGKNAG